VVIVNAHEIFPGGCPWQVQVPSGNPEPDSEADCWMIVECGAEVTLTHDDQGWRCVNGHEHIPIEIALAPFGPEWEREQADRSHA
jgi:hypothetical protein